VQATSANCLAASDAYNKEISHLSPLRELPALDAEECRLNSPSNLNSWPTAHLGTRKYFSNGQLQLFPKTAAAYDILHKASALPTPRCKQSRRLSDHCSSSDSIHTRCPRTPRTLRPHIICTARCLPVRAKATPGPIRSCETFPSGDPNSACRPCPHLLAAAINYRTTKGRDH
jgi:hypothetical protein